MENEVHVSDVLALPTLAGTSVVAGCAGLGRRVYNVSVVAGSEITQWVKPGSALLSTGHPLRDKADSMPEVIRELDARSVACLAVRLGSYLDDFPPGLLETAEEVGLPVIRLTDSFAFDDILIDVLGRINAALLADLELVERVHAALSGIVMSGGTAARVATEAARLLSAQVRLLDPLGTPLPSPGAAPPGTPEDWRQLEATARDPRTRTEPVESVVLRLGGPGNLLGYLAARRPGRPFSAGEVRALERSAAVAALAHAQQSAVRDVEAQFQSEILTRLLRGEFDEVDAAASRLHELGWRLRPPMVVAAVGVWARGGQRLRDPRAVLWLRSTGLALLRQSLRGSGASGMVGHELVAVVPADAASRLPDALQQVMDKFAHRAAGELGHGISVGISADCPTLQDAPRSLRQAQVAMRAGRLRSGPPRPTTFGELGALGLVLAAAGDDDAAELVAQVLAPLDRLPAREAEGLLATLRVLVAQNMTFVDAARALHCHYNTVRHRVHRLEELLGPFSTDPDLRVNISLALRMREFATEGG